MLSRLDVLVQHRLDKLEKIRALGIDPYPHRFQPSHPAHVVVTLLEQESAPEEVTVAGRIVAHRAMGKAAFMDLRDFSGKIQLYLRKDRVSEDDFNLYKHLDVGDFVGVSGHPFRTHAGEATVEVKKLTVLCKSLQPLPEKWHGLTDVEKRYRHRHLDLVSSPEVRNIFLTRSRIVSAMRRFLDGKGFIEVETPVLQPHAGGAMARPFITHHNVLDQDLYLRIATELHLKRLIVGGLDKVYEIGKIFRNEGIDTRHNPEFTSLESYEAYADYNSVMAMVEEMINSIALSVLGTNKFEYAGSTIDLTPPWPRTTLRQAILQYAGIDYFEFPDAAALAPRVRDKGIPVDNTMGRGKLIDELLSKLVEPHLVQPAFIIDYPTELSPLAKKKPDNPALVERFEAFIGTLEVANAFTELNDPLDQRERFSQQLRAHEAGDEEAETPDEDFLSAIEYGMPPAGGLGVGIDRLVMLMTNQQSIREVILFPQMKRIE